MLNVIENGMPRSDSPISNTVESGGKVYSVQIPRHPETGIPSGEGDIEMQTHRVLQQLQYSMEAAGGTMQNVAQVVIYLVNAADAPGMNKVYRSYFTEPYPNRATVIVKALLGENNLIEIVVHGVVDPSAPKKYRIGSDHKAAQ